MKVRYAMDRAVKVRYAMRADQLMPALVSIQKRWIYNLLQSNVTPNGNRRRDDVPWTGLIVLGDLGPDEGHECFSYDPLEGCIEEGHMRYEFVAWIDFMGTVHYVSERGSDA